MRTVRRRSRGGRSREVSPARGDPAAVKGYYRLIDQPEASAVTVSNILAPHRERTRQRMQGQRTVLCIQDGSDLNFTRHGRCEGLGVIGRNQTGATARRTASARDAGGE